MIPKQRSRETPPDHSHTDNDDIQGENRRPNIDGSILPPVLTPLTVINHSMAVLSKNTSSIFLFI